MNKLVKIVCCSLLATTFVICESCSQKEDTSRFHEDVISLEKKLDSINNVLSDAKETLEQIKIKEKQNAQAALSSESGSHPAALSSESGSHPDIIIRIIHLPNNDKAGLKIPTSYVYKTTYAKLSSEEKKAIDDVIQHPAYSTTVIPKENKTIADALDYLNSKLQ